MSIFEGEVDREDEYIYRRRRGRVVRRSAHSLAVEAAISEVLRDAQLIPRPPRKPKHFIEYADTVPYTPAPDRELLPATGAHCQPVAEALGGTIGSLALDIIEAGDVLRLSQQLCHSQEGLPDGPAPDFI